MEYIIIIQEISLNLVFPKGFFAKLFKGTKSGQTASVEGSNIRTAFIHFCHPIIFDDKVFARKVEQKSGADMIQNQQPTFYVGVKQKEVEEFYAGKTMPDDPKTNFDWIKFRSSKS